MTTTTTSTGHVVINGRHQPEIPLWAFERIRHAKEDIMVSDYPHIDHKDPKHCLTAMEAEWKAVFDVLGELLDPNYDGGWVEVPVKRKGGSV